MPISSSADTGSNTERPFESPRHFGAARGRNRRIIASSSLGIFQRIVQVVCTILVMPAMLRALGPAQFGIWGAAASVAWFAGLADIGTGAALVTLVARRSASDGLEACRRYLAGALTLGFVIAGLIICMAVGISRLGTFQVESWATLIAVSGLAFNVPLSAANNFWIGLQKGYIAAGWDLVQTLATTAGLLVASTYTSNVLVYVSIVYAGLVLANLGSLIHLFLKNPELRRHLFDHPVERVKEVAGHGIMYFLLNLMVGLSYLGDNVLALVLLGPEASARMTIALRICVTALGLLTVLSQPLWPAFAEAAENADRHWIRKIVLRGTVMLVGATAAGSILVVGTGERLLRLWLSNDLGIGRALLWAIGGWTLAQAAIRVPHLLLNGLSILRFQILLFTGVTLLSLVLKVALSSQLGVAGILWGTAIPLFLIALPALFWRIRILQSDLPQPLNL